MRPLFLLFFFFSFLSPLQAEELSLISQLSKAQEKSWIVAELNKNYILLYIREIRPQSILIEEVTLPSSNIPPQFNWRTWFEQGAKGHTLWVLSEVSLKNGQFERSYSYTQRHWLNLAHCSSFMTTLLNLRFTPVPIVYRKRIGLAPPPRTEDLRPFWQPRLIVEGEKIAKIPFHAWQARWPSDKSELAGKRIEIYLPEESYYNQYPSFFPYWLEVEGRMGSAKVRIVDSGMSALSPQPLPR